MTEELPRGLLMEAETVSMPYKNHSILTLLIAQAGLTTSNCCESLKYYCIFRGNHSSLFILNII
jgi:hypothetical protein